MFIPVSLCMYGCIHVSVCMYVNVFMSYMYVCIFMYFYVIIGECVKCLKKSCYKCLYVIKHVENYTRELYSSNCGIVKLRK